MFLKGFQQLGNREQEHAGIPQIPPGCQHLFSGFRVGLFHEPLERQGALPCWRSFQFDIPIAGFGPVRRNPKGNEAPFAGGLAGLGDSKCKGIGVVQDMVGRCDQHQRVWVGLGDKHGCSSNRGRGIPAFGFDDDTLWRDPDLGHLLAHDEPIIEARQHDGRGTFQSNKPLHGGLKQTAIPKNTAELFGMRFARRRPQPLARTTTQNYRENFIQGHIVPFRCYRLKRLSLLVTY